MVEGGSSDDQAIAFRATDQRCLMAMALVRRPGRCLERLAGDQLQGVERGGERLVSKDVGQIRGGEGHLVEK